MAVIHIDDADVDVIVRVLEDTIAQLRLATHSAESRADSVHALVCARATDRRSRIVRVLRGFLR